MRGAMLLPQDHERHAATLEFFVHLRPVGQRLRGALVEARRREQPSLQRGVADLRRDRPREPDHLGAPHVLRNRRLADACCLAHLTDAGAPATWPVAAWGQHPGKIWRIGCRGLRAPLPYSSSIALRW